MTDNNVRLQTLRDFTVQTRDSLERIVGTGIAVSMDGKIVTCRNVVETAINSKNVDGAKVGVTFPQARGGEEKSRKAMVEKNIADVDDDTIMLKLTSGASQLAPEQIVVPGAAEPSEGNPFRIYGYSPIGDYPASRGEGIVLGTIESPAGQNLQIDLLQLESLDIAAGKSGAAVLDIEHNLVVGLVSERYYPPSIVQDEFAYSVDSKVLIFPPFDFVLQDGALPLKPAPLGRSNNTARRALRVGLLRKPLRGRVPRSGVELPQRRADRSETGAIVEPARRLLARCWARGVPCLCWMASR